MVVATVPLDPVELKLAAPRIRAGTVAKAHAIERLRGSGARIVTVLAPAGYGKTTLIARWAEADPRPFAWVTLDGTDGDVVELVAAAVRRVEPGAAGIALAFGRPLVLVLDDLHTVTDPDALDALVRLVEHAPAGAQIVMAGRELPPLPLARWRTLGWVEEVGVADLRLDEGEAASLLAATGVDVDASELAELTARTEGWAAGLYLAALSLLSGTPRAAAISGDDRFVSEYLRLELLSRLSAAEAQFLRRTAVMDRFSGALCDAVLDTTGSAQMLATLERKHCFLVALDRRGEWFRHHQLVAELLRTELARSEPAVVPALNRRAMAWCVAGDRPEAAVAYGRAAGETGTVAGLIDALAPVLVRDGRTRTLEEWLGWFSDDELARYPALAVHGARLRMLTGRPAEAERWLALAEGATSAIPLSDGSDTVGPWTANLRAHLMRDGAEQSVADADRALGGLPPASPWVPDALLIRGVARALLGAFAPAREDLAAAVDTGRALGAVDAVLVAEAELALLAADQGAWGAAARHAAAADALVEGAARGDCATSAIAHVAVARVAIHEARPGDAREPLTRAHRLRPHLGHGLPWLAVQVGLELTRAHLALADAGAARTVLAETERVLEARPRMGSLVEDARALRERVAATTGPAGAWAMSLTGAELRLLPYLATHLTFPEIAGRLFISRNTVKTEAVAIYRKLGASSRSEAIERAVEVGLLESPIYPPRAAAL